jgi:hypothetical protein
LVYCFRFGNLTVAFIHLLFNLEPWLRLSVFSWVVLLISICSELNLLQSNHIFCIVHPVALIFSFTIFDWFLQVYWLFIRLLWVCFARSNTICIVIFQMYGSTCFRPITMVLRADSKFVVEPAVYKG